MAHNGAAMTMTTAMTSAIEEQKNCKFRDNRTYMLPSPRQNRHMYKFPMRTVDNHLADLGRHVLSNGLLDSSDDIVKAGRSEQVTEEAGFAWSSNLIFGEEEDATSCSSMMSLTTPSEIELKMTANESKMMMTMSSEEMNFNNKNQKNYYHSNSNSNSNSNMLSDSEESMITEYEWLEVIKMVDVGIQTDLSCLEEEKMKISEDLCNWKGKIEFKDKEIMELCEALSEEIKEQNEEMTLNQLEMVRKSINEKDSEIADLYEKISHELTFQTNNDKLNDFNLNIPLKRMETRPVAALNTNYNNNNYCNNKIYNHQLNQNKNLVRNLSRNSTKSLSSSTMQAQGSEILNNIQSQGSDMFRSFNDNDIQTIPEVSSVSCDYDNSHCLVNSKDMKSSFKDMSMRIQNLEKEVKEKDLIITQSEELLRQMLALYRQNRNNCYMNTDNKYNSIDNQVQMMYPYHPRHLMMTNYYSNENNNSFTSCQSRISPMSSFSDKSNHDLHNVISRQDSQIRCLMEELNKYQQCQHGT